MDREQREEAVAVRPVTEHFLRGTDTARRAVQHGAPVMTEDANQENDPPPAPPTPSHNFTREGVPGTAEEERGRREIGVKERERQEGEAEERG